jgi:RHS repeat-associated protein
MSGKLDNYSGTANALLTWSTQLHDAVTTVSGYGDCLETRFIDALGKAKKTLVDGAGRTIRSIDQLDNATAYTYDADGNQLSVRDPNSVGRDVVYDALGRAGLTTDTASDTTDSSYDRAGNRIAAIDGKSNSTTYAFDARGRQKSQTDRLSGVTSFTYLATGQLASLTDAESQTTSYTYDDAGRKLTETYPDHTGGSPGQASYGIVTLTRDAAGRTLRKQDQQGDSCTYFYDLAGRLSERDYRTLANSPFGTIADSDTFAYDKAGRMLTAVSGRYSNTVTYTYDTAGRTATESLTISGQTYTTTSGYNPRGELTSITYPDGTAAGRSYTDRGQLYQLAHSGTTIDTRTYDNGGRMTGSAYNNGVSESRSYNADNTLSGISFTGAPIGNLSYSWDDNKNKTSETIGGTMSGYGFSIPTNGYDDEDRLVNYNRTDGNLDQSWSLSEVGDWDSVTTEGTAESRIHGPTHELLSAGGSNVSTDVKGNITLIPSALRPNATSLLLSWDFDNRLNTADVGNNSSIDVTYKFDALGRRVFRDDGTNAVVYVQSGQQTIADYTSGTAASSPTYRYVYASYIDEPVLRYKPSATESLYYHRNQQYSIVALTDGSGAIVERYAYSAYGAPTITDGSGSGRSASVYGNRYTYTGREWDAALLMYHYRARMYDSSLGRFCSRDPVAALGGVTAAVHEQLARLYSYCRNHPSRYVDPMGLQEEDPETLIDQLQDLIDKIKDVTDTDPEDLIDTSPYGLPLKPDDIISVGTDYLDVFVDFAFELGNESSPCSRYFKKATNCILCAWADCPTRRGAGARPCCGSLVPPQPLIWNAGD